MAYLDRQTDTFIFKILSSFYLKW